jgi:hypothetical protein
VRAFLIAIARIVEILLFLMNGFRFDVKSLFNSTCMAAAELAQDCSRRVQCPASEVRDTSQHALTRTSEAKGHSLVFDSSAAYRFEVPERACRR